MDTERIDGIAATIGRSGGRRAALRLLGGAALAAVGIAAAKEPEALARGGAAAEAKRKKKNRTCRPGRRVATVSVPADGSVAVTPVVLRAGQRYRLRASGFWLTNATRGVDAAADFALANPAGDVVKVFEGVRLGLEVDGGSPDLWGAYSPGHVYERTLAGPGRVVAFRHADVVQTDNSGTLTVDVFCD